LLLVDLTKIFEKQIKEAGVSLKKTEGLGPDYMLGLGAWNSSMVASCGKAG
jgi:hypothetical protein